MRSSRSSGRLAIVVAVAGVILSGDALGQPKTTDAPAGKSGYDADRAQIEKQQNKKRSEDEKFDRELNKKLKSICRGC